MLKATAVRPREPPQKQELRVSVAFQVTDMCPTVSFSTPVGNYWALVHVSGEDVRGIQRSVFGCVVLMADALLSAAPGFLAVWPMCDSTFSIRVRVLHRTYLPRAIR